MDLIRRLLIKIEEHISNDAFLPQVDGVEKPINDYHLRLLYEAGFIEGLQVTTGEVFVSKLTWAGHDFLDDIRDDSIWEKTKGAATSVGSFSLEFISSLAKGFIKQKAKELTGIDIE